MSENIALWEKKFGEGIRLINPRNKQERLLKYICFVPLKNYVEVIYSLDRHFLEIGKKYNVKVVNPAQEWLNI